MEGSAFTTHTAEGIYLMARRGGIIHALNQAQREAERQQKAYLRAQAQAVRAYEQAQKAYERATAADQKEKARLYAESRAAQAAQYDHLRGAGLHPNPRGRRYGWLAPPHPRADGLR